MSVASSDSVASQATVTPETVSSSSAPVTGNIPPSPLRRSHTVSVTNVAVPQVSTITSGQRPKTPSKKNNRKIIKLFLLQISSPPQQSTSDSMAVEMSTSVSSMSERDSCSEKDRDSMWDKDRSESRASSSTSAATLTNVSGSVMEIWTLVLKA